MLKKIIILIFLIKQKLILSSSENFPVSNHKNNFSLPINSYFLGYCIIGFLLTLIYKKLCLSLESNMSNDNKKNDLILNNKKLFLLGFIFSCFNIKLIHNYLIKNNIKENVYKIYGTIFIFSLFIPYILYTFFNIIKKKYNMRYIDNINKEKNRHEAMNEDNKPSIDYLPYDTIYPAYMYNSKPGNGTALEPYRNLLSFLQKKKTVAS